MPVKPRPKPRSAVAPAAPSREILIANRHPRLRLRRAEVIRVIQILDANPAALRIPPARIPPGELSLVFLNDQALATLHADFLDDPTTTDVITFEGEGGPGVPAEARTAGEICVSVDTAATYARAHGHDFSTELTLYVVHGWLHLAGFDDLVPAKKRVMRRAEARALALLQQADAMPRFAWR